MRSAVRAAACRRRVGWVNGTSRSVVEDRLVHVERLVEPAEAVASPDPLAARRGRIGAGSLGIRGIGPGEAGAAQPHLAQVRAALPGADLTDADVAGADLTGAILKGIRGRDRLRGLDKALHVDQAIFND